MMQNKHETEKVFIREDGTRVRATATFKGHANPNYGIVAYGLYTLEVHARKKGAQKWHGIINTDETVFRRASFPEGRDALVRKAQLNVLSAQEIDSVLLQLWEKLKPAKVEVKGAGNHE